MVITVAGEKKEVKDGLTLPAGIDRAGKCRDTGVCNRFY